MYPFVFHFTQTHASQTSVLGTGLGLVEPRCFMYHHITCLLSKSFPPPTPVPHRRCITFLFGVLEAILPRRPNTPTISPSLSLTHPGEESCRSSRCVLCNDNACSSAECSSSRIGPNEAWA